MPVPLIIPAIAAGAAVVKGIQGYAQKRKADKALDELNKSPFPEYGISTELQGAYDKAQAMSKMGFAPEEKAQFQQQLARSQSGMRQSALDLSGGGMGGAINSVMQAQQTGAINEFAAKGAGLRRENIRYADTLASAIQSQKNLQMQQKIARRQMLEQNYGQASAMGTENIFGAVQDISNVGMATFGSGRLGAQADSTPTETITETNVEFSGLKSPYSGYNPWATTE